MYLNVYLNKIKAPHTIYINIDYLKLCNVSSQKSIPKNPDRSSFSYWNCDIYLFKMSTSMQKFSNINFFGLPFKQQSEKC